MLERLRGNAVPVDQLRVGFDDGYQWVHGRLVRLLADTGAHGDALVAAERARARAFTDLLSSRQLGAEPAPAAPPPIDGIVAQARRLQTSVVTYWSDADGVLIWVVTADGLTGARVGGGAPRSSGPTRGTHVESVGIPGPVRAARLRLPAALRSAGAPIESAVRAARCRGADDRAARGAVPPVVRRPAGGGWPPPRRAHGGALRALDGRVDHARPSRPRAGRRAGPAWSWPVRGLRPRPSASGCRRSRRGGRRARRGAPAGGARRPRARARASHRERRARSCSPTPASSISPPMRSSPTTARWTRSWPSQAKPPAMTATAG